MATNFFETCKQYFESDNFYEILKIKKDASDKDVKKAYHKLSLLVHPDRVNEKLKNEATEKFKVLGRIHSILSDKNKRAVYDETGQIDDEGESSGMEMRDWGAYWRMLFKEITIDDINNYEKSYKGSEEEIRDLKKAYTAGKGDFNLIHEMVPFCKISDEPRFLDIMKEIVEKEELPYYKSFFEEPKAKKQRRNRKYAKEAEEAERLQTMLDLDKQNDKNETSDDADLQMLIKKRNQSRAQEMDNFLDALAAKYDQPKKKPKKTNGVKTRSNNK